MEKDKPQLSEKQAIVERNGVKVGAHERYFNYIYGVLLPCIIQGQFGVIRRTCNYS